jgi:uncharacterized protein YciI
MYFLMIARDRPGLLEVRLATRPAHKAYLREPGLPGRCVMGAPLADDDEATMKGTFLVIEAPNRAAAEAFADGDPYAKAGLFEAREIIALHSAFDAAQILPLKP